jgi:hypothetical protein
MKLSRILVIFVAAAVLLGPWLREQHTDTNRNPFL